MAYQKTQWNTGDPITQERMNKLEQGVATAQQTAETGISNAATAQSKADANTGEISNLSSAIDTIRRDMTYNNQRIAQGESAWAQVRPAITMNGDNVTKSLLQRFTEDEGKISSLETEVHTARGTQSALVDRLDAIDGITGSIESLRGTVQSINTTFATASNSETYGIPHGSVDARLEYDEAKIKASEDEIALAHSSEAFNRKKQSDVLDTSFISLDARFEYDEEQIKSNTTAIGNLNTNKINYSDVVADLETNNNMPLAASQGRELKQTIGGSYSSSNTVASGIANAEQNAKDYADGKLGSGFNTTDTVAAAISNLQSTDTSLNERLTTAEGKLTAALTSSVVRTPGANEGDPDTDTTYGSLDARLEAIETHAASVHADVNTIAGELALNGTAIVNTNTRIDGIANEINAAHRTDSDTLDNRFDAIEGRATTLESTIDNQTTGLAATKTIADQALAKANDAATASSVTTLAGRVTALEGKDTSATIIIGKNSITYNSEGIPTNIGTTPIEANDYLLQNTDNKYYYWKYIGESPNGSWELISGAGGGGGGTSSAAFAATLADISDPNVNTDYFVGNDTDGYIHYRYIDKSGTLTPFIMGVDPDNIKTYNATTSTTGEGNEQVTYLDLYEFDYGVDNTTIDPQASTLRAHIPLPAGGGGSNNNITARLVRIGEETVPVIVNSKVNLYVFFSAWDSDQSYSGNYTFKYNNTTIDTGTFASGAVSATPINWVVVEEPEFNNDVPVISAPDTTKLYIVKTGNTFTQWTYANSTWSSVAGAPAGFYALDISNYCKTASINNIFSLSVSYGTDTTPVGKTWRVNIYDLYIESEAPETLLINSTSSYGFVYTAFGALDKTLHVLIDNNNVGTKSLSASTSGRADTFTITPTMIQNVAGYIHGVHKIEMYLTANIGGITRTTSKIARDYIWYDVTDTDTPIIIASPYRGQTLDVQQYSTLSIPYQVYQKDTDEITVKYYLDNVLYDEVHLDRVNEGTFNYVVTADEGTHTIKIMVEEEYIQVTLNVSEMEDVDISPIDGAIIDFDPSILSNSSINRLPSWTVSLDGVNSTTYAFTASSNFNWSEDISGGGYKKDDNNEKCFVIKAGSYIDLNYPMFANNVFTNGAEMKITFKTAAVRNVEAVWYQNVGEISGKTVGIQLNAHNGWLKTDKAVSTTTLADEDSDEDTITVKGITYTYWKTNTAYSVDDIRVIRNTIYRCTGAVDALATDLQDENVDLDEDPAKSYLKKWLKIGQLDTEILATNSYLYFPYSENDKIELDININKSAANNNFIMSYEDGVPSKAYAYTTGAGGDKITHSGTIRIGSNDCDVYIYRLRYYAEALTTAEILQNFIADGATIDDKIDRYNRNCIYWDSTQERYFTSPSQTASLDPVKLAERMPDVKILMLETPTFTTGKKDFVQGASLRCLHAKGGKIYESRGDEDNWFFYNGFHAGQGTTSDNYGQAGRNVDFLFEVDGTNYPTKAKNMGKYKPSQDYVSKVVIGEEASEWVETAPNSGVYHWVAARQPETNEVCDDWKGDKCKVSLTESSVPNNYFNLKVNIASSENVNNALFQKRYDDFLAYQSPAQAAQIAKHGAAYRAMGLDTDKTKVKNGMEFVPAVLFVRETGVGLDGTTPVARNEFNDDKWHFYALGNIGDSKKSDYTRAYDPDDMNEFTCENSDNNTNNGQFQSGVFVYNSHNAIETDYSGWNETTAYKTNDVVVYNGMVYTRTGADQAALGENETYSWVAADWTAITYTGWTDQDPPYFAPRTNPNPMEYIYPITSSQWNVKLGDNYLNRKHMTLVTEEFDGDHSFEFRYGCKGDYRDGDLINDTNGDSEISDGKGGYRTNDDVQFDINHDVMLAMYEWLITATPEQYENEAPQWFVKSAMEFFYAYTHYYTMMDNRAKNTFWHFAKTGVRRPVSRPVEALYHVYEVADGTVTVSNGVATGNFKKPEGSFNPSGTYYTQYAFDLWVYDCDTAVGIDNNGALVFPYGKEDEDYRVDGEPSSGYAFNGAGSIFWRRLKTTFADEITSIMNQADKKCFNSEDLIKEFDDFQSCFPEEIWRLDIERKYIRTYTGASKDKSITEGKQNARFLMSMMQGRKKYQRRQWIRDQGFYFNSKYNIGDISTNRTEFNIVSPAGDHSLLAVQPDYHLRLTPYQDMYLNVVVGNGTPIPPIRAKANQEYTIKLDDYAAGNFAETRVYIGGFKMISKLGGLAPMYPYSFTLNGLDHLKELDIGTDNSGYRNGNFTELPLTNEVNLPLLETLNIKNCNALATSIGLRTANNLRTVEAVGSSIGGISLPEYTQIETLHLPTTVTDIVLHGARFLKDFIVADRNGVENYSNIYTLDINDSDYSINFKDNPSDPLPVDWISIAIAMLEKESPQTHVSLTGLYSATIGDIQELEPIAQAKSTIEAAGGLVDLTGVIHVTGVWSEIEKESYSGTSTSTWPNLRLDCTGTQQTKWPVTYQHTSYTLDDGTVVQEENIRTIYINDGAVAPDIYYTGVIDMPTQPSDVRHNYTFGRYDSGDYIPYSGWTLSNSSTSLSNGPVIHEPTVLQTYFSTTTRTYPIKWYLNTDKTGLIKTSDPVEYEAGVDQEAPSIIDIHNLGYSTATVSINNSNNTANYSIFKGWQELPNKIHPSANDTSFNIYGDWETAENVDLGAMFNENNIDNLTPEQLLVLSAMTDEQKRRFNIYNKIEDCVTRCTYTTGQDSIKEGTLLVGTTTNPIYRADRDRGVIRDGLATTVQPFKAGNDAFTIAIDYSFNPEFVYNHGDTSRNSPKMGVLASCYERNVTANTAGGFVLYYNLNSSVGAFGPRLGFGNIFGTDKEASNQSVELGQATTAQYRNIIVLRHPAGSNSLYIYSGMSEKDSLPQEVTITSITWNNFNSDMYLRFGCLIDQNSLTDDANYSDLKDTVDYGGGTIYWAKYWNEDLGIGECKRLAVWPHEKMTYLLTHLNTSATSGMRANPTSQAPIPSITLTSLTASIHGIVAMEDYQASNVTPVSWSIAPLRTLMNKRVFLGLPTKLQAIMCKGQVANMEMYKDGQSYRINNNQLVYTRDYLYAPSKSNVVRSYTNGTTDYSQEENEVFRPYSYIDTTNLELKQWSANSDTWVDYTDASAYAYLNLRFAAVPLTWSNKLRVYIDTNENITSLSSKLGNIVREGDIYISGNTTAGQAYMYISDTTRRNTGVQVASSAKFNMGDGNNVGGWTPSYPYWLRSMSNAGGVQNRSNYYYILPTGYVIEQPPRLKGSANISYSIAI